MLFRPYSFPSISPESLKRSIFAASAGGAGNDVRPDFPDVQGPQDAVGDADFQHGTPRDGDADGVADSLVQQDADADGRFDGGVDQGPRLRDAEVERVIALSGHRAIGFDHGRHIGRFQGQLDIPEIHRLEKVKAPQGALHQRIRRGPAVLLQQILFQGTCVDPDPDGRIPRLGRPDNGFEPVHGHVAGVDADPVRPSLHGFQGQPVIEVDIRDQRNVDFFTDGRDGGGSLQVRNGDPDDFTTGLLQGADLPRRRFDIPRVGAGHGLHGHRRAAADLDAADKNRPRFVSPDHWFQQGSPVNAPAPLPAGAGVKMVQALNRHMINDC